MKKFLMLPTLVLGEVPVGKLPVGRKKSRTEVEYLVMILVS